jgi:hypothetical protein
MLNRCTVLLPTAIAIGFFSGRVEGQSVIQNTFTVEPFNAWVWYRGAVNSENGFTMLTRPLHQGADTTLNIGVIRTDSSGALLETRTLLPDDGGNDAPVHILRSANGTGWIAGMHSSPAFPYGHHTLLMRLDQQDDVLWSTFFPLLDDHGTTVFDIVETSDGGVALLSMRVPESGENSIPFIIRVDPGGEVLWTKRLNLAPSTLYYMDVLPNDDLVLSGSLIDSTGHSDLLIVGVSADGSVAWGRAFGGDGNDRAYRTVYDPWYGLVTAGSTTVDGISRGVILRTDIYAEGQQTRLYGSSVYDAHAFPDGSLMVFASLPGGTNMVRLDASGDPLWATVLELNMGEGRLLPYAESSRFAYFSGDWYETITLNTFTAQCTSCGEPGDLTQTSEAFVLPVQNVVVTTSDISIGTESVQITSASCVVQRSLDCELSIPDAIDGPMMPGAQRGCSVNADGLIAFTGFGKGPKVIIDASGRSVRQVELRDERTWGDIKAIGLPALAPGIYVLADRSAGCRFAITGDTP